MHEADCSALFALSITRTALAGPSAEERRAAIAFADDGVRALERGDYERAVLQFTRAYQVAPVPSFALWLARSLRRLGRLRAALARYTDAITLDIDGMEPQKRRLKAKQK